MSLCPILFGDELHLELQDDLLPLCEGLTDFFDISVLISVFACGSYSSTVDVRVLGM